MLVQKKSLNLNELDKSLTYIVKCEDNAGWECEVGGLYYLQYNNRSLYGDMWRILQDDGIWLYITPSECLQFRLVGTKGHTERLTATQLRRCTVTERTKRYDKPQEQHMSNNETPNTSLHWNNDKGHMDPSRMDPNVKYMARYNGGGLFPTLTEGDIATLRPNHCSRSQWKVVRPDGEDSKGIYDSELQCFTILGPEDGPNIEDIGKTLDKCELKAGYVYAVRADEDFMALTEGELYDIVVTQGSSRKGLLRKVLNDGTGECYNLFGGEDEKCTLMSHGYPLPSPKPLESPVSEAQRLLQQQIDELNEAQESLTAQQQEVSQKIKTLQQQAKEFK